MSLMNTDTKILKKILAIQVKQFIIRITYHYQVRCIPGMQVWFNMYKSIIVINHTTFNQSIHHINKLKNENHMIISIDAEKAFYNKLKSLSHVWLCDPMDCCSLPGSSVHEILQARTLEWVACPPPQDLPHPGIKSTSLLSPELEAGFFITSATWEATRRP